MLYFKNTFSIKRGFYKRKGSYQKRIRKKLINSQELSRVDEAALSNQEESKEVELNHDVDEGVEACTKLVLEKQILKLLSPVLSVPPPDFDGYQKPENVMSKIDELIETIETKKM